MTLTCCVELDPSVDVPLNITTVWSDPDGSILTSAAPSVMRRDTHYTSKLRLSYVHSEDSGTYTCDVFVDGRYAASAERVVTIGKYSDPLMFIVQTTVKIYLWCVL